MGAINLTSARKHNQSRHSTSMKNISNYHNYNIYNMETRSGKKGLPSRITDIASTEDSSRNRKKSFKTYSRTQENSNNLLKNKGVEDLFNESFGDSKKKILDDNTIMSTQADSLKRFNSLCSYNDIIEEQKNNEVIDISNKREKMKEKKPEQNHEINADILQKSYISKLINNKIWSTNQDKTHNSLIIFDWDDTLMFTSYLTPNGLFEDNIVIPVKDVEKVKLLEKYAYQLLSMAVERGETYIITNAAPGWVEYSCKRFYPLVFPLLEKVKILSARGLYERKFPTNAKQWKIQTFLDIHQHYDSNLLTNIICLGDSVIEMEAGILLASKFNNAYIKTIKFRENPKPEELIKQLSLVIDQFDAICMSIKNLTIRVEKKPKTTSV